MLCDRQVGNVGRLTKVMLKVMIKNLFERRG
jgi:hypothetical protein